MGSTWHIAHEQYMDHHYKDTYRTEAEEASAVLLFHDHHERIGSRDALDLKQKVSSVNKGNAQTTCNTSLLNR